MYLTLADIEKMGLGMDERNRAFDSLTDEDLVHFRYIHYAIIDTMVMALFSKDEDKDTALKIVAEFIGAVFTLGVQVAERRNKEDAR